MRKVGQTGVRMSAADRGPWSAWRRGMVTVGPSVVGGRAGAGARRCAPCETWESSWPRATTRRSQRLTSGFVPRGMFNKSL